MTFTEALRILSPQAPCPHDAYDDSLGYGGVWAKCHDCGVTFEVERHDRSRRSNQAFSEALDVLKQQAETLDAVRDALGNGADEEAWPVGMTLPEAVARLRAMPAEVERRAHEAGLYARRMGEAQRSRDKARDDERAAVVAWLRGNTCGCHDFAGDIERGEHREHRSGLVAVPRDVLDKLHDHLCGPERSDPVADPLWAELGRYLDGKGRKP